MRKVVRAVVFTSVRICLTCSKKFFDKGDNVCPYCPSPKGDHPLVTFRASEITPLRAKAIQMSGEIRRRE